MKQRLIQEFNALNIKGMDKITDLFQAKGSYVNLKYELSSGQKVKLWDDEKIYFINQIEKKGSQRCYGLTADENYLLVCEYGENGTNAEIIIYKKWNMNE